MDIITNGHRLALVDLTYDSECGWRPVRSADFDVDGDAEYPESYLGFRYRGDFYALCEFEQTAGAGEGGTYRELHDKGWHGTQADSVWTGLAIRYVPAGEAPEFLSDDAVVVARVCWA